MIFGSAVRGWFRYSVRSLLVVVLVFSLGAHAWNLWPCKSTLFTWWGPGTIVSTTRGKYDPKTPLYHSTLQERVALTTSRFPQLDVDPGEVFVPLYGQTAPTAQQILAKGFDGLATIVVFVRILGQSRIEVESRRVSDGAQISTGLRTAIDSVKAFDRFAFTLPPGTRIRGRQNKKLGHAVEVQCLSGPSFRVHFINDWGEYYFTDFEGSRTLVKEYEALATAHNDAWNRYGQQMHDLRVLDNW